MIRRDDVTFNYIVFEFSGQVNLKVSCVCLHLSICKKFRKSFAELNLSSSLFCNHSFVQRRFTVFFLYYFFNCLHHLNGNKAIVYHINRKKNSIIKNKTIEISQPKTICSLKKPKIICSKRNKTTKEYFPMQIMCCFLLHDILKMKFEGLNLMCCCAKPNKYYQYVCKIGSFKFDRGGAA